MRSSDWSSDVCSSDLPLLACLQLRFHLFALGHVLAQHDDIQFFALGVAGERKTVMHPDDRAVLANIALVDNEGLPAPREQLLNQALHARYIVRVRYGAGIHLHEFFARIADRKSVV